MIKSTRRSGIKIWRNLPGTGRNLSRVNTHFCMLCLLRSFLLVLVLLSSFVFKEAIKINCFLMSPLLSPFSIVEFFVLLRVWFVRQSWVMLTCT